MDHAIHPHHVLTDGQLSETLRMIAADTEIRIRWDQDAYARRCEEEANIEEALAALKLERQP